MSLTLSDLEEFKTHLGVSGNSENVVLTQFLEGIESAVRNWTGRDFIRETVTEYHDGPNSVNLILRVRPLVSVTSVHVDPTGYSGHGTNAFADNTEWTIGEDFYPDSLDVSEKNGAILVGIRRTWPAGQGNIKVVYVAGYSSIPPDLKLGIYNLGAIVREAAESGQVKGSETIGRYAYSILNGERDAGGANIVQARSLIGSYCEVDL